MLAAKILNKVNYVRSGVYFLESLPLRIATQFVAPADGKPPTKEELGNLYSRITKLHDRETELISAGVYPISALEIENPWRHMRSYAAVMRDGVRLMWRMRKSTPRRIFVRGRGKQGRLAEILHAQLSLPNRWLPERSFGAHLRPPSGGSFRGHGRRPAARDLACSQKICQRQWPLA